MINMRKELVAMRVKTSCEIMDCKDPILKSKLFKLLAAIDDAYFCLLKSQNMAR